MNESNDLNLYGRALNALTGLSYEDLRALNHEIVVRLKRSVDQRSLLVSETLRIGDTVTFDGKSRGVITGDVVSLGRGTTLKVRQHGVNTRRALWSVTASLVKKVGK